VISPHPSDCLGGTYGHAAQALTRSLLSFPPVPIEVTGYSASNSVARASFAVSGCTARRWGWHLSKRGYIFASLPVAPHFFLGLHLIKNIDKSVYTISCLCHYLSIPSAVCTIISLHHYLCVPLSVYTISCLYHYLSTPLSVCIIICLYH